MKTSKIKEVVSAKPHSNGNIYHNLVMENGDKLNIGKKKQQSVGMELTYEITDEQSGEFKQAKSIMPPLKPFGDPSKAGEYNASHSPSVNVQNMIVAQSCISSACTLYQQSQSAHPQNVLSAAAMFYEFVMKKA